MQCTLVTIKIGGGITLKFKVCTQNINKLFLHLTVLISLTTLLPDKKHTQLVTNLVKPSTTVE